MPIEKRPTAQRLNRRMRCIAALIGELVGSQKSSHTHRHALQTGTNMNGSRQKRAEHNRHNVADPVFDLVLKMNRPILSMADCGPMGEILSIICISRQDDTMVSGNIQPRIAKTRLYHA